MPEQDPLEQALLAVEQEESGSPASGMAMRVTEKRVPLPEQSASDAVQMGVTNIRTPMGPLPVVSGPEGARVQVTATGPKQPKQPKPDALDSLYQQVAAEEVNQSAAGRLSVQFAREMAEAARDQQHWAESEKLGGPNPVAHGDAIRRGAEARRALIQHFHQGVGGAESLAQRLSVIPDVDLDIPDSRLQSTQNQRLYGQPFKVNPRKVAEQAIREGYAEWLARQARTLALQGQFDDPKRYNPEQVPEHFADMMRSQVPAEYESLSGPVGNALAAVVWKRQAREAQREKPLYDLAKRYIAGTETDMDRILDMPAEDRKRFLGYVYEATVSDARAGDVAIKAVESGRRGALKIWSGLQGFAGNEFGAPPELADERDRIEAELKAKGYNFPSGLSITQNMPADVKKLVAGYHKAAAEVQKGQKRVQAYGEIRRDIDRIQQAKDPLAGSDWFEQAVIDASASVPYMATYMAASLGGPVGTAAAQVVLAASKAVDFQDDLRKMGVEITPEVRGLSFAAGFLYQQIEKMQAEGLLLKSAPAKAAAQSFLRRFAGYLGDRIKRHGVNYIEENAEEILQQGVDWMVALAVANQDPNVKIDWEAKKAEFGKSLGPMMISMGLMVAPGAAVDVARDFKPSVMDVDGGITAGDAAEMDANARELMVRRSAEGQARKTPSAEPVAAQEPAKVAAGARHIAARARDFVSSQPPASVQELADKDKLSRTDAAKVLGVSRNDPAVYDQKDRNAIQEELKKEIANAEPGVEAVPGEAPVAPEPGGIYIEEEPEIVPGPVAAEGTLTSTESPSQNAPAPESLPTAEAAPPAPAEAPLAPENATERRKQFDRRMTERRHVADKLTGVADSNSIRSAARKAVEADPQQDFVMLDVDEFKAVNEEYTHKGGDEVLKTLGAMLREHFPDENVQVGRPGGEEFVLIVPKGFDVNRLAAFQRDVANSLQTPKGEPITISAGFAPGGSVNTEGELDLAADSLLKQAKVAGRNRLAVPTPDGGVRFITGPEVGSREYIRRQQARRVEEGAKGLLAAPELLPPGVRDALEGTVQALGRARDALPGQAGERVPGREAAPAAGTGRGTGPVLAGRGRRGGKDIAGGSGPAEAGGFRVGQSVKALLGQATKNFTPGFKIDSIDQLADGTHYRLTNPKTKATAYVTGDKLAPYKGAEAARLKRQQYAKVSKQTAARAKRVKATLNEWLHQAEKRAYSEGGEPDPEMRALWDRETELLENFPEPADAFQRAQWSDWHRDVAEKAGREFGVENYDEVEGESALTMAAEARLKQWAAEDAGDKKLELAPDWDKDAKQGELFAGDPAADAALSADQQWATEHADEITTAAYRAALAGGASESMAEDVASETWLRMREGTRTITPAAKESTAGLITYVKNTSRSVLADMRQANRYRAGYERKGGAQKPATEERKFITTAAEAEKAIKLALPGSTVQDNGDGSISVTLPNTDGEQFTVELTQRIALTPAQWSAKERRDKRKYSIEVRRTVSVLGSMVVRTKDGRLIPNRTIMQLAMGLAHEGTPAHETVHLARAIGAFTTKQWSDLVAKYSTPGASLFQQEEDVAAARAEWVTRDWWQKLKDFCRKLLSAIRPGWRSRGEDVMRLMDTAGFWQTPAAEQAPAGETRYEMPPIPEGEVRERPLGEKTEPDTAGIIKAAKKAISTMDLRHVPVEVVDALRAVVKALRPETQVSAFQVAMHKAVEAGSLPANVYVNRAEARLSQLQGSIGTMAPSDARMVIDAVQSMVGREANRNRLFASEKYKDRNAAVKALVEAATGRLGEKYKPAPGQKTEVRGTPWFRHVAYYMNLIPASLVRRLFGKNAVARDLLVDSFTRGGSEFHRLEKGITARSAEFMREVGLKPKELERWIGHKAKNAENVDVALPSGTRLQIPKGQFLGLALSLRDKRTRDEILRGSPIVLERAGTPLNLTAADVAAVETAVRADPKLGEAAAGLSRLLNEGELSEEFFRAWRDVHGVDLGRVADYFPSPRDMASLPPDAEAEMREFEATTLESRGPFRERTAGLQPFLVRDAFESVDYVQRLQALYAAKHRPTMDALNMLAAPEVVRAVRAGSKTGEWLLNILKKRAQEYNGAQGYTGRWDALDKMVKWFMRQRHRTALAFKPWIWFYQPVSLISAMARIPARFIAQGVLNSTRHYNETLAAMSKSSGMLNARVNADVHDRISPTLSFGEGFSNRWGIHETPWVDRLAPGMGMIRKMDTRAIAAIWEACVAQAKDQGLTGEEATRAAVRQCEMIVEETQPTFDDHTLSALQAWGRQNPLAKFLSMFTSQTTKNFSLLDEAVQDIMHPDDPGAGYAAAGKKLAILMGQSMAIYGIRTGCFLGLTAAASVAAALLGRGSPEDPDDKERWVDHLVLLLDGMFGNIPAIGQVVQSLRRGMLPTQKEESRAPFRRRVLEVDAFKPVTDGVNSMSDAWKLSGRWKEMSTEQKRKAVKNLSEEILRTSGGWGAAQYIPTDALAMVADPLYKAVYERPERIPSKAYSKALDLTARIPEQKDGETYEDFWRRYIQTQRDREAAAQWLAGLDLSYHDLVQLVSKGAVERGATTERFRNGNPTRWDTILDAMVYYGKGK